MNKKTKEALKRRGRGLQAVGWDAYMAGESVPGCHPLKDEGWQPHRFIPGKTRAFARGARAAEMYLTQHGGQRTHFRNNGNTGI